MTAAMPRLRKLSVDGSGTLAITCVPETLVNWLTSGLTFMVSATGSEEHPPSELASHQKLEPVNRVGD